MKLPTQLPNVKLTKEIFGANLILGIYGAKAEIEKFFNFLYNWGAAPHSAELEYLNDGLGAFQLNEETMISSLASFFTTRLVENDGVSEEVAKKIGDRTANDYVKNIPYDRFLSGGSYAYSRDTEGF
jgi:hypothetical protein